MAKYQDFLNSIAVNRDRTALRGIFSMFLTDDNPPKLIAGIKLTTGAGAGKVLTSDANGDATWETSSGGGGFLVTQVFS